MTVLGTADIVLRAITTALKGDVQKGLDESAKQVEASGDKQGEAYAAHFGDQAEKDLEKDLGNKVSSGIERGYNDSRGNKDGKSLSDKLLNGFKGAFTSGFKNVLTGITAATTGLSVAGGLAGLIGSAVGAVDALGVGLVGLTAAAAPAAAALGVGLVSGVGALIQGAGVAALYLKDLSKSAKNLPPAAEAARASFQGFETQFKSMVSQVGSTTVFPALEGAFKQLAGGSLPLVKNGLQQTSEAIASVINDFTGLLKQPVFTNNLGIVLKTNANSIKTMGGAFVNLGAAAAAVLAAATPMINRFTTWFGTLASHIATVSQTGSALGKMTTFFAQAGNVVAQLGSILHGVGSSLLSIGKAAFPLGEALLGGWQKAALGAATYLKSAQGASQLQAIFSPSGPLAKNLQAVGGLVKPLLEDLGKLGLNTGVAQLANGIKAVLPGVTEVLQGAITAIGTVGAALGRAFQSPAGQAGLKALTTGLKDFGGAIAQLEPVVGPLLTIVGQLATNLSNLLGPAFKAIAPLITSLEGPLNTVEQALSTVLLATIRTLVPLIQQLAPMIAQLAQAFAGPLAAAVQLAGTAIRIVLDILQPIVKVLSGLAPVITAVGVAWGSWKILSQIAGYLQAFASVLGIAAQGLGKFGGVVTAGATGLSKLAGALPVIGTAVALLGFAFQLSSQQSTAWADALLKGGSAADTASQQMGQLASIVHAGSSGFTGAISDILGMGAGFNILGKTLDDTKTKYQDQLNQMDPLQRAQAMLAQATNNYNNDVKNMGQNSMLAVAAHQQMVYWQGQVTQKSIDEATQQGNLAQAAGEVAANMYSELAAQQAIAGASTATHSAVLGLEQAQQNLLQTQSQYPASSLQVQSAQLGVQQAVEGVINTASQSAQTWAVQAVKAGEFANNATGMASAVKAGMQVQATALQQLADAIPAGPLHDAVQTAIDQFDALGKVKADPKIDAPDATNFNNGIADFHNKMNDANNTKATPLIGAPDLTPLNNGVGTAKISLKGLADFPVKTVADIDWTKVANGVAAALGDTNALNNQKPTPTANLNPGPFNGVLQGVRGSIQTLAGQTPTPTANLNPDPYNRTQAQILGELFGLGKQSANPNVNAVDNASGVISAVKQGLSGIVDKTVHITTVYTAIGTPVNVAGNQITSGHATGGLIKQNEWATVGEQGRELVFLSQGSFVATYAQAQKILQAAALQNKSINTGGVTGNLVDGNMLAPTAGGGAGVVVPVTVYPAPQMDEAALGRKVGQEIAWRLGKL